MHDRRIGIIRQLVPPEPVWNTSNVPDQTGKIVIVTGGNEGIGRETSKVGFPSLISVWPFTD
jgi:hypothetical protein